MKVGRRYEFAASHWLPHHKGKCQRLHGHNYVLEVEVTGEPFAGFHSQTGMVIDFYELDEIVNDRIIRRYDHQHLNEFFRNPTAELMVAQFWRDLAAALLEWNELDAPKGQTVYFARELSRVRLYETERSYAEVSA